MIDQPYHRFTMTSQMETGKPIFFGKIEFNLKRFGFDFVLSLENNNINEANLVLW